MIRRELLKILVCPEDRSPLAVASSGLLARVNAAIARRQLKNRANATLEQLLDGGLVRGDQKLLYPIVDEIPMLLIDEAIPLDQAALGGDA
ncbi:MAG: Trm112 family protein [Pirellulales bacterium]